MFLYPAMAEQVGCGTPCMLVMKPECAGGRRSWGHSPAGEY